MLSNKARVYPGGAEGNGRLSAESRGRQSTRCWRRRVTTSWARTEDYRVSCEDGRWTACLRRTWRRHHERPRRVNSRSWRSVQATTIQKMWLNELGELHIAYMQYKEMRERLMMTDPVSATNSVVSKDGTKKVKKIKKKVVVVPPK